MAEPVPPIITQWLLDTRDLWPVSSSSLKASEQMAEFSSRASKELAVLPSSTRTKVLRFYFPKDARLSLASALLKHLIVTHHTSPSVLWSQVTISEDQFRKPCYIVEASPYPSSKPFDFNLSHQAGLVSLIASNDGAVTVGTDIVCVDERIDHAYSTIDREGFGSWVDLHADVFHPLELTKMKGAGGDLNLDLGNDDESLKAVSSCNRRKIPDIEIRGSERRSKSSTVTASQVIDAKIRRFYAFWALREAYVKMTGEALLAPWLKELNFGLQKLRAPEPSENATDDGLEPGEVIRDLNVWLKGTRVDDVALELRAYGKHYMIASAVKYQRSQEIVFHGYETLDLEKDVMSKADVILDPNE